MNLITFRHVVSPQRKDGTYSISIRVTFKRRRRYLMTSITLVPSQVTRGGNIRDAGAIRSIEETIRDLREKTSKLNVTELSNMEVDDLVEFLKRDDDEFSLDFPTFARERIGRMGAGAKNYGSALASLTAFMGTERYDIGQITSSKLERWQGWLEDKYGKGARALSLYTQSIAHLHQLARKAYNDEEEGRILIKNPFVKYTCPKQSPGKHRDIAPAIIQMMLLWRGRLEGRERLGVDVFLLSFALMGANAPDLMECSIRGAEVCYNRRKTRDRRTDEAEMHVRIESQLRWLVEEYTTKDGKSFIFGRRYAGYREFSQAVNYGLHQFERRLGLTAPLTLYVARHTFATIARSRMCNIDKSVVNEMICHVDPSMRVTDIYVKKDWNVIWNANAKVQVLFPW